MQNILRIRGCCFVSYKSDIRGLPPVELRPMCRKLSDKGANPVIFHSKEQKDIGAKLIGALKGCKALSYLAMSGTLTSSWVSLELYYAERFGLPVYKYEPTADSINLDKNIKVHLPVFPSYSHLDRDKVEPILNPLRSLGIMTPQDLIFGTDWKKEIDNNINKWIDSGGIIAVLLSSKTLKSDWVKYEYTSGLETGQVLPILLEKIEWDDIPRSLKNVQCAKIEEYPSEKLFNSIDKMVQNTAIKMEEKSNKYDTMALIPCSDAMDKNGV